MSSTKKNKHIEYTEDLSIEILHVINAIKSPDSSKQMNENKEIIFKNINNKINSDPVTLQDKSKKRRLFFDYLSIASVVTLLLVSSATLMYFHGYQSGTKELALNLVEINVPPGTISTINLSDGSKVTLNGGSKLTYPAIFTNNREVTLSGEGFFDVAKDDKKPFFVHTTNLSTKVLGTRFGFKAYNDDSQTILTLEEGSVNAIPTNDQLKEGIILRPNQQILMDNLTGEFTRRNVNAEEYISWKDGILTFRDLTLGEITVILQRRFDVKIHISSDNIKNQRYAAQFKYGENIEQILDKLSYKRSWKYIKQNGTIELINR